MAKFVIQGGTKLSGEIPVRGAKNTADMCLAACLLTKEDVIIKNLPLIADIQDFLEIFRSMNVLVEMVEPGTIRVNARDIDPSKIDQSLVRKMRYSTLLFGALLGRLHQATLASPGGDKIGARPMTTHLDAFIALGATVSQENGLHVLSATALTGTTIILDEMSVTGTANAMLAAVLATGQTVIKHAACEPHIDNFMELLNTLGAKVRWGGNHIIVIDGVTELHGGTHSVNPDYLEMWTFLSLGVATKSNISIRPFVPEYLETELLHLRDMGGKYEIAGDVLTVQPTTALRAPRQRVHSLPYPGFAADNIPPFVVLATQAQGSTLVMEWMYEGRQKYAYDLMRMGADITILDTHRILIKGATPLYARETTSYDIRAGATMVIAAMIAQGESTVTDIENIDRGYEKLEERLNAIGANIQRTV